MNIWVKISQIIVGLVLTAPIVAICLLSFSPTKGMDFFYQPLNATIKWWKVLFFDSTWLTAITTSITVALISTVVAIIVTIPVSVTLRISGNRLSQFMLTVAGLALFIPPIVMAVGIYSFFQFTDLFDTILGLSFAHLSVTVPIVGFIFSERLRGSSISGYQVALALGATKLDAVVTWLLAYHRPSLIAATLTSIMGSLSEATLTIFLTDTHVLTIARKVLSGTSKDINPSSYAAMLIWIAIVLAIYLLVVKLLNYTQMR